MLDKIFLKTFMVLAVYFISGAEKTEQWQMTKAVLAALGLAWAWTTRKNSVTRDVLTLTINSKIWHFLNKIAAKTSQINQNYSSTQLCVLADRFVGNLSHRFGKELRSYESESYRQILSQNVEIRKRRMSGGDKTRMTQWKNAGKTQEVRKTN